ncbi:hypothetical protein [Labilibaculum sp.]|uniref:hypothetical protein n=1 Tax=Labilibaculum sp. TaxID=2060723 RepID=UPI00356679FE
MKSRPRILTAFLLLGLLTISISSCFNEDDYDFDRLSDNIEWTPNLIVPVSYGSYSLWYLLNQHEANTEDQSIVLDEEGLLHIQYSQEDIFSYTVADVLDFPNQEALDFSYSLPDASLGISYSSFENPDPQTDQIQIITSEEDIILYELDLDANIQFLFTNPLNTEIEINISLPNASSTESSVTETYTIAANATNQEESLSLSDLNILFNNPYTNSNEIDITFEIAVQDNASHIITGSGDLEITLAVEDIDFSLAQGDFGNQIITLESGNIDMNVDFWDNVEGDYQFTDPSISLYAQNSIGVPFQINADITGYSSNGNTASLNPSSEAQFENFPTTIAEVASGITDTLIFDKDNSDIVNLMALPPSEQLSYSGSVTLNPGSTAPSSSSPNIISNQSAIDVDIKIDVPLNLTADNLTLKDTVNNLDISDTEDIMNAAIIIVAENGYPLNVSIDKIYFTDENYQIIDSISDQEVIDAAEVFTTGDNIGEVDESSIQEVTHEIELTESQIENLNQTKNLIINASVSTDNDNIAVKLMGDDELVFTISVQAQVNLSN